MRANKESKRIRCSVILADPPYGWGLADWDSPENVWPIEYWLDLLKEASLVAAESCTFVVFGDLVNVFPPFSVFVVSARHIGLHLVWGTSLREWERRAA